MISERRSNTASQLGNCLGRIHGRMLSTMASHSSFPADETSLQEGRRRHHTFTSRMIDTLQPQGVFRKPVGVNVDERWMFVLENVCHMGVEEGISSAELGSSTASSILRSSRGSSTGGCRVQSPSTTARRSCDGRTVQQRILSTLFKACRSAFNSSKAF